MALCYCRVQSHLWHHTQLSSRAQEQLIRREEIQGKAARMSRAREVLHEEIFSISVVSRLRYDQGTRNPLWHKEE